MKDNKNQNKQVNYDNHYHNCISKTNTLQEFQSFPVWGIGRPVYKGNTPIFSPALNYPPLYYRNIASLLDRTIIVLPYKFWEVAR